jgi:hypothetical protein
MARTFETRPETASPLIESLGPGAPMPQQTRQRMESVFGESFAGVQIHDGPEAGSVSRAHAAQALTVGNHVAFAPGNYRPGTPVGDAMLAHELAHTLQQEGASPTGAPALEPVGSALESDADRAAVGAMQALWGRDRVPAASPTSVRPALASALRVQRCSCSSPPPATFDGNVRPLAFDPVLAQTDVSVLDGDDGRAVAMSPMYLNSGTVEATGGTDEHAREWKAGFLQTAVSVRRVFNYATTAGRRYKRRVTTLPGPHRDGGTEDNPFYSPRASRQFPGTNTTVDVHMDDLPKSRDAWSIDGGAGQLVATEGRDQFCSWLVVRHTERGTVIPLSWDTWEIDWRTSVDPVAKTSTQTGQGARITDQGDDQGPLAPVLTGPSGNDVLNGPGRMREEPWT